MSTTSKVEKILKKQIKSGKHYFCCQFIEINKTYSAFEPFVNPSFWPMPKIVRPARSTEEAILDTLVDCTAQIIALISEFRPEKHILFLKVIPMYYNFKTKIIKIAVYEGTKYDLHIADPIPVDTIVYE